LRTPSPLAAEIQSAPRRPDLGPPPHPHLYEAEVREVIDADTLLLDIGLAFEVIRRQSIRLARIDAPPRDTPQGAAGRRFVRNVICRATSA